LKEFVEETVQILIKNGYKNKNLFLKLNKQKLENLQKICGLKEIVHDFILNKVQSLLNLTTKKNSNEKDIEKK
jgi:hypothetical protein